jgi:mannose-1-phosphate guanylyltransferase
VKAVMLVGGFGTRLQPLTLSTPKPMLPLVNIPFLEIELLHLREYGVEEVILSTGYLPTAFDEYFGDGSRLGMKLVHVTEDEPLGTCGAIKNVSEHLGSEPVLVCNGDILTDLDIGRLVDYHDEKSAAVTITLTPVDDPTAYGLVPLDEEGRIEEFLEKPTWDQVVTDLINAGTYVLDPLVLEQVPRRENYSFERQLFPDLLEQGERLFGFPSDCYWLDLGTPEKYLTAHHDILDGRIEIDLAGERVGDRVFAGEGVRLADGVVLDGPVVMGRGVRVEPGAVIGARTSLGNDVTIREGAEVKGSVILDGAVVGRGCGVADSIVGAGTVLGETNVVAEVSVLGDNIRTGRDNEFRRGVRVWPSTVFEDCTIRFSKGP